MYVFFLFSDKNLHMFSLSIPINDRVVNAAIVLYAEYNISLQLFIKYLLFIVNSFFSKSSLVILKSMLGFLKSQSLQ